MRVRPRLLNVDSGVARKGHIKLHGVRSIVSCSLHGSRCISHAPCYALHVLWFLRWRVLRVHVVACCYVTCCMFHVACAGASALLRAHRIDNILIEFTDAAPPAYLYVRPARIRRAVNSLPTTRSRQNTAMLYATILHTYSMCNMQHATHKMRHVQTQNLRISLWYCPDRVMAVACRTP